MDEAGEKPQEPLHAELDRSRENLLRFIRLEFAMAETLWGLWKQTEKKRQRKRLRDDIRKAKVSIVHFKKKLGPVEGQAEVDEYIGKIDAILEQSGTPSVADFFLKRLRQRARRLRKRSSLDKRARS